MKLLLSLIAALFLLASPAKAESLVVQQCGTLPQQYAIGSTRYDVVDINGNTCVGPSPTVLTGPQAYSGGSAQPVGIDAQGGVIPATGLRTAPVSCSATCTTFGSGANGVLLTVSAWPYNTIDFDVTSAGTGTTLQYEVSNDNPTNCAASVNWVQTIVNRGSLLGVAPNTQSAAADHFIATTNAACIRVHVIAYTSGTITVGAYQTASPQFPHGVSVTGSGSNGTPAAGAGQPSPVVVSVNPFPAGATAISAIGTGTTGAVTATLAAVAGKFTYMCGVTVSALGGTAAVSPITITNMNGSTFTFQFSSSASGSTFSQVFTPCIPTSATNTAMVITTTADGTATAVDVNAWGFQL